MHKRGHLGGSVWTDTEGSFAFMEIFGNMPAHQVMINKHGRCVLVFIYDVPFSYRWISLSFDKSTLPSDG